MARRITGKRVEKPESGISQPADDRRTWKTSGFAGRLRAAIGMRRASEVARAVGIPQQTLDNYLKGAAPNAERALALADELGVNIRWLIKGEGQRSVVEQSDADWLVLFRFDMAKFEPGDIPPPVEKMRIRREWISRAVHTTHRLWLTTLLSDAMPEIGREGDLVLCQDAQPELSDGHVYVLLLDGRPIVRRVQVRPEGLMLKAGPETEPITIAADSQQMLAPVGRILASVFQPV